MKRKEIDLILQKNPYSKPVAVEIKSNSSPMAGDIKALTTFAKDNTAAECYVLCTTEPLYTDEGVSFPPFLTVIPQVLEAALDRGQSS